MSRNRAAGDGRSQVVALTERGFAATARDVNHMDAWLRARVDAEPNATEREVLRLAATLPDRPAADEDAEEDEGEGKGKGGTGEGDG
ncbi:hypothetical protein [Streptomyces sp. NRRL F-5123]|uniref:hypothetical protein n=1 Tax=Streptomyces sp. NRRL F-5123 TaxID=1463856 RepID=UPI0004E23953|nr:hypothetical protein [Streptomyces sp. NRRL F-5123]